MHDVGGSKVLQNVSSWGTAETTLAGKFTVELCFHVAFATTSSLKTKRVTVPKNLRKSEGSVNHIFSIARRSRRVLFGER
ncbi:hypothetical protein Ocin01_18225 [Orchesella cincta]|uniref:Uncharacterized protein n=1 Tax=Orchesella cincta TaxID=48709 RepID=A0A1D2M663_ORCCI|nr:hypothetical protein Ocin01_18225 [Orchesella cincta]